MAIHSQLRHAVESIATELGMGKLAQSLHDTIIGRAASPGIDETPMPVGKEFASRRIDKAASVYHQA